ncbi:MAG: nucleotidyl transferase AbiEii/AbiGii toxin family protein [Gemmatimonadota bacterium]
MHPKVLSDAGWQIVARLGRAGLLDGWVLAGGTGLALQLGHRYSEDLDLFRAGSFDPERLAADLSEVGETVVQSRSEDTLHAVVDGLRISFLRARPALLFPGVEYRELRVADPRDIAVMKVIAIGSRGSRKDFIDLYFYLRGGATLDGVFELLRRRFQRLDYNEYHLLKSLVFFDHAEAEPMPSMVKPVEWSEVRRQIEGAVRRLS